MHIDVFVIKWLSLIVMQAKRCIQKKSDKERGDSNGPGVKDRAAKCKLKAALNLNP